MILNDGSDFILITIKFLSSVVNYRDNILRVISTGKNNYPDDKQE